MKVFIKNKFSLGGDSTVVNEAGETIFKVDGKVISPTRKKLIYDAAGNLLYTVRNKWFNFLSNRVYIFQGENKVATIKKGKFSFSASFEIEDCVDTMSIEGKFFRRDCKIMKNGQVAGVITKEFTIINDAFTLEAEESDIAFMTALVIAFDNLRDKVRKDNSD